MSLPILHLTLKEKWFALIGDNTKTEEYRLVNPYWIPRLLHCSMPKEQADDNKNVAENLVYDIFENNYSPEEVLKAYRCTFKQFAGVIFKNGYQKNSPTLAFKEVTLSIGKGNPTWGAPDHYVFILKLASPIDTQTLLAENPKPPKHKFKRLPGIQTMVLSRCEYCGLEREGLKGEYTYLTKRLSPNSGRYTISHSETMPPCKEKKEV